MFAAIDIGSNTVQMMICSVAAGRLCDHRNYIRTTRLGMGSNGVLPASAIELTAQAVAEYMDIITQENVEQVSILATSAVRDAINADELREAIRQAAPNAVEMEVLSGEQEAMLSAWGAVSAAGADVAYPVLDVGGASSELIYMGQGIESFSANVGAVRVVREGWSRSDVRDRLAAVYRKLRLSDKIIGVGGAITSAAGVIKGLSEYDRYAIEGTLLKKSQLEDLCAYYESMSIDQRCQSSPLMAQRGSIIVEGLWIWLSALDILDIDVVQVTGGGLLDGAVCKMAGLIPRYSCLE